MSYKPRLKKHVPYSISEYNKSQDYYGYVGEFTISCGLMDGHSVANALRRNILTKSVGYAVVAYRIEGSESPFDVIHGFDLTTNAIVDNLSKIQFSLVGKGDYDVASIELDKFTGDITAGMFASDSVTVHNPELVIARVSNVPVKIDCGIGLGYGYISEEDQKQYFDLSDGWFVKEAHFNPVSKVSYTCHQYGEEDIVDMKIHCNLSADPLDIFAASARDLSYIFTIPIEENTNEDGSQNADDICNAFLTIPIDTCGDLSARARNALVHGGVPDLRRLLSFSPTSLSAKISGIGDKSIQSIGEFLSNYVTDELVSVLKRNPERYPENAAVLDNINSYILKSKEFRDAGAREDDAAAADSSYKDESTDDESYGGRK